MKKTQHILLILSLLLVSFSCENKELDLEDYCAPCNKVIRVVVNWDDHDKDSRVMRINLLSNTTNVDHYGLDDVPESGAKNIQLTENASYWSYCYDYNATNIYFRNVATCELFEAYCIQATRDTYNNLATPVEGEETVAEPGEFYVHSLKDPFEVEFTPESPDTLILNFCPQNPVREYTFCIRGIKGYKNIQSIRGAISGMRYIYHFKSAEVVNTPGTILFDSGTAGGTDETGYITGKFYSFVSASPNKNRFTIEILSKENKYLTAYWDVSRQMNESETDRPAKLARDGYDILIENKTIPEIPGTTDPDDGNPGFEIGVNDWDNVDIFL